MSGCKELRITWNWLLFPCKDADLVKRALSYAGQLRHDLRQEGPLAEIANDMCRKEVCDQ
jgi:hypothetical protein